MAKRATIQDVATQSGVSITTVSRFLNGHFGAMSQQTRQKIEAVISTLNYQPNTLAQGLKGSRSRTIAVVVVNIGYPFCVSLIRALTDVFTSSGYRLVVCETGGDPIREQQCLSALEAQQIDAIVMQTNGDNNAQVAELAARIPVVLVDRRFDIPSVTTVITNNEASSYQLTSHLLVNGYQRVLYVTEPPDQVSTRIERLDGYRRACLDSQVPPWIAYVDRSEQNSFDKVIHQLIEHKSLVPVAVYTANGLLMLDLYPLLKAIQWHIPNHLGVSTFDEPDWVHVATPSLTCVRQPVKAMGEFTATRVLQLLEDGSKKRKRVQVLESALVVRDSTRLCQRDASQSIALSRW